MKNEINYSIVDYEGLKVVKLIGSISSSIKDELEVLIDNLLQKNSLILNLKEVNVITSGGLNSLIKLSVEAKKKKKRIMLMGIHDPIIKMMEEMDVYQYFSFISSIEEGQARLKYIL